MGIFLNNNDIPVKESPTQTKRKIPTPIVVKPAGNEPGQIMRCIPLVMRKGFVKLGKPTFSRQLDNVLENERDFLKNYEEIIRDAFSFCYVASCDDYLDSSSPSIMFKQYFESENLLIQEKQTHFRLCRIIKNKPDSYHQELFKEHLKYMKPSLINNKYVVKKGDLDNIELAIADFIEGNTIFYKAIFIILDENGIPLWGYKFNSRENFADSRKITAIKKIFENAWDKSSTIRIFNSGK